MTLRTTAALALLAGLLAGCSSAPPLKPEPVDVSGTVTLPNGRPATDLTVSFLPTESNQFQTSGKVTAGKFSTKLVPGKYTFMIESPTVPKKYQENNAAHAVEVPPTGTTDLAIKLTN